MNSAAQDIAPFTNPVFPHAVFAARKIAFETLVCGVHTAVAARSLLFHHLPLAAHGWDIDRTKVTRLHNLHRGSVFRVERLT